MMEGVDGNEQAGGLGSRNSTLLEVNKPSSRFEPPANSDLNFSINLGASVPLFVGLGSWIA